MNAAVVENHHEVLLPWTADRLEKGYAAPVVLTLDHHTDILPAFRDPEIPVVPDSWRNLAAVKKAISQLRHDEHFNWALRAGLIERCEISSHVNATPPSLPELIVHCDERWQDENHVFADPDRFRSLADSVLETDYLISVFGTELPENFILDIDCDYFSTEKSFHPDDISFFKEMTQRAKMISVSLERDWVRILRFPGEKFTAEDVVKALFGLQVAL